LSVLTEFLFIGLKQQLAKISSCSLDTAHSARNLGFILMNIMTRYQLCLNPATRTSVNFAASDHISLAKQPVPSPHPSCTPSLTIVTHFTTT